MKQITKVTPRRLHQNTDSTDKFKNLLYKPNSKKKMSQKKSNRFLKLKKKIDIVSLQMKNGDYNSVSKSRSYRKRYGSKEYGAKYKTSMSKYNFNSMKEKEFKLSWDFKLKKGMSYYNIDKKNQDNYFAKECLGAKNQFFFGICDGHGESGHKVSKFLVDHLPDNFERLLRSQKLNEKK